MTLLALVGPTASGKSRLALEVAVARGGVEIVAIDAFTVYRGMDVGTAKPSAQERARVPHHGIDLLDPAEDLSVARYQRWARAAIADIGGRGATPLLVGGSGLYFRAVVDDLEFPPTDPSVRRRLTDEFAASPEDAHAHLADLDPEAAARIDPGNLRRSVRALEVLELTGRRFSAFARAWDDFRSIYPGLDVARLAPAADVLRRRIDERARRMVAAGLLDEAVQLRRGAPLSATAAQAIGYREAFAVLDGEMAAADLADAIAQRTWRYAKRQRAWFDRDPRCQPVDPSEVVRRWRGRDGW